MSEDHKPHTYSASGVDTEAADRGLSFLARHIRATLTLRDGESVGRPLRGLGYYANVLDLGDGRGLAVSTDGVGTKLMVAEAIGRYDTVGIDCIAMNVNDLICVGADPIAILDYVALGRVTDSVLDQLGRGLLEGCRQCRVTIPGGELAQVGEMLRGEGETRGLDLVGTAIGIVPLDRMLFGQDVTPGDQVIGVSSSGLHSNGFTLARKVLVPNPGDYGRHEPALGRTIGEELLEPTALYVAFARDLFAEPLQLHAVCHITGDGFVNLTRVEADVGFILDDIPDPPAVFRMIEERGSIPKAEMFTVFNMGIGLCLMLPPGREEAVSALADRHGFTAGVIGRVTDEPGIVRIPQHGLVSRGGRLVTG